MLPLDDPRWESLHSGAADALRNIEAVVQEESVPDEGWQDLYWLFCNQGTVYLRSYAAVPHLVRLSRRATLAVRFELLKLVAAIERGRLRDAVEPLPEDWQPAYRHALAEARSSLAVCVSEQSWDFKQALELSAMFLTLNGFTQAGFEVSRMDDWIECRNCGSVLLPPQHGDGQSTPTDLPRA
jgi:hypothetical protein